MENKIIPTAEEFLQQRDCIRNVEDFYNDVQPIDLIEFAKLHVEAALKNASEKAEAFVRTNGEWTSSNVTAGVNKDSILNSYPLENIK